MKNQNYQVILIFYMVHLNYYRLLNLLIQLFDLVFIFIAGILRKMLMRI
jgi:hypothetical protein